MKIPAFELERWFAEYEFNAPYLLCCSDCETHTVQELLALEPESDEKFKSLSLGYTETRGSDELRKAIAERYTKIGADGLLTHAGQEGIFLFMNAALNPGDHVIVQGPCYQSLYEIARTIGCEVSFWKMQDDEYNKWSLDLDELEGMVQPNTKAIIVNMPHNPTGFLMNKAEYNRLIDITTRADALLFSDEVYRYLEHDQKDRLPAAADTYENAVCLGVMSKSYGLPGLRIGWLATRNKELLDAMACLRDYTTICSSAPSEFLASIALRNHEELIARSMKIISGNLDVLDSFFSQHKSLFTWSRPKAGPIAFPRLLDSHKVDEWCQELVAQSGVLLLPGTTYGFRGNNFRIGFGRKNMPECLGRLEEHLSRQ